MNSNDARSGDLEQTYRGASDAFTALFNEISKVIVGQKDTVEQIIIAILSNGHALMESNPGLGKTLTVSTISKTLDLSFSRVQCTPDLMPADITGTHFIEETGGKKEFKFEPGPVFANIVLADEINRASPKTQSALLEAMQEKQVTVGNDTFILDKPFFLLATQNPIEMEGTFPLPEAQLDRFLLKIVLDYPSFEEEKEIVRRYTKSDEPHVGKVLDKNMVLQLQRLTRDMPIADDIKERAIKIIMATRTWKEYIEFGASPRASIGLILAAKARALVRGRNFVSVEDVDAMAYPVLRHRIILTFESERRGISQDHVIKEILAKVK
ncbi:AAA family ATPase [Methanococcoides burtonii]|uniref:MoxR-like AAA-3 family ATPase n=1 Tax=Methanococcoides burtonii (strain DSM 6242 / NBRC 107633 / OCM 468 / ACE-M) TaxID=259564 RepID=Q12XR6_METBU|nr:MoxR family ATPase [Methanococcoides burtonii]ABE51760.1 MoxR-like AAA-3 family ATPase [Methanococcoides burtonii DSM 6242]